MAASKCRLRKLERISVLDAQAQTLKADNERLAALADKLRCDGTSSTKPKCNASFIVAPHSIEYFGWSRTFISTELVEIGKDMANFRPFSGNISVSYS